MGDLTGTVIETPEQLASMCEEIAKLIGHADVAVTHVAVEQIRVDGRHRRDFGDIGELASSIKDVGLLSPIAVTPDLRLVAGGRRLRAYEYLGWPAIPARVVNNLADAAALLRAERDENTCRKDMLPSEKAALGAALAKVEAPVAKERQGTRTDLGIQLSPLQRGKLDRKSRETNAVVGEALGMHRSTYEELRFVHNVATDEKRPDVERELAQQVLDDMDAGKGIQPAARGLRRQLRAKQEATAVKESALADVGGDSTEGVDWEPAASDRAPEAVARRRDLIRQWADKAWTSHQIADRLGTTAEIVRRIARKEDIAIPADQLLGRTHKKIDSNRIVRETIASIDSLEMSLGLVNYDELDRSEIENWTVSLTASIRVLNRLNKRLKEMVQ